MYVHQIVLASFHILETFFMINCQSINNSVDRDILFLYFFSTYMNYINFAQTLYYIDFTLHYIYLKY